MKKKKFKIIFFVIILFLFDRLTKLLVIRELSNNSLTIINNFLDFVFVKNNGAAFGLFGNQTIFLILISIGLIIYLIYELKKGKSNSLFVCSLSLIISGSIGNLIDRILYGYVIDFISFTLLGIGMPVFNIADILITFGVIIYIYIMIRDDKNERNRSIRGK